MFVQKGINRENKNKAEGGRKEGIKGEVGEEKEEKKEKRDRVLLLSTRSSAPNCSFDIQCSLFSSFVLCLFLAPRCN